MRQIDGIHLDYPFLGNRRVRDELERLGLRVSRKNIRRLMRRRRSAQYEDIYLRAIYRLNEARLAGYEPGRGRQSAGFDAAQDKLGTALDSLFAAAELELTDLPEHAREGKALRSLVNHREGLSVFADHPRVPLDNNLAERLLRGPAIGRRLSFGSDSGTGARFTALMYSVVGTLNLNRIDVLRWLEAWLSACADHGGRPPDNLAPWLPWSMDAPRRREMAAPT